MKVCYPCFNAFVFVKVEAFCWMHHKVESCGWAELELNPLPKVCVSIVEFRQNLIELVTSHKDILPLARSVRMLKSFLN